MRLLEKRGHRVALADNGKEALEALENSSFDLVLMDVQMPEMDGLEATAELRNREKTTGLHQPVVAMTALAMKGDKERCIAAGMDGYLTKPIRQAALDEVLDQYLGGKRDNPALAAKPSSTRDSVDAVELLERIDGDLSFLTELVELFAIDYPRRLLDAREALAHRDAQGVVKACHALKGALANLAAISASGMAQHLESRAKAGDLTGMTEELQQLELELQRVQVRLENIQPTSVGVI